MNQSKGYSDELSKQHKRLESIGIFKKIRFDDDICPFCLQNSKNKIPHIEDIEDSLRNLDKNLQNVEKEFPKLVDYIENLETQKESIINKIKLLESKIDALYRKEAETKIYKELNTRIGIVLGRISLWLESIEISDDNSILYQDLADAQNKVKKLESMLDDEDMEDRLNTILNRMGINMTKWAKSLELEHSENPIRFDIKKLTVFADTSSKPIPLQKMGSGENWVGYHLITYFALHKHFVDNSKPVPRFIFLDQPSQAYFPPDRETSIFTNFTDLQDEDRIAINRLYEFIFRMANEIIPGIQIIFTDHALINSSNFIDNLNEIWRKGQENEALIPYSWTDSNKYLYSFYSLHTCGDGLCA